MNLRKYCLAVIASSVWSIRILGFALLVGLVGSPSAFGQDLVLTSQTGGTYNYVFNGEGTGGFIFGGNGQTAIVISGLSGVTGATILPATQTCGSLPNCTLIGNLSSDGEAFTSATIPGCGLSVGAFDSGSVTLVVTAPAGQNCGFFGDYGYDYFGTLQIVSTVTTLGNVNAALYLNEDPPTPPSVQTTTGPVASPTYSCTGFQAPFNVALSLPKKTNRAIPLKAQLFDSSNNLVTPTTLGTAAAPVVNVSYQSGTHSTAVDDTSSLVPVGASSSGNQFTFDPTTGTWWFNLSTAPFTGSGTYTVTLHSGDASYQVVPQCSGQFVRP